MGYVDYGKISFLDVICQVCVVVGEVGGIIQYIGVYQVEIEYNNEQCKFIFLDILGYEVFMVM